MIGYGYFMFEELLYTADGVLITDGPQNYKIPCVMDVPEKFNVTLLRDSRNLKTVYSSKVIETKKCVYIMGKERVDTWTLIIRF